MLRGTTAERSTAKPVAKSRFVSRATALENAEEHDATAERLAPPATEEDIAHGRRHRSPYWAR